MNSSYVTDTMALVLRLESRKLPPKVKRVFENAENGNTTIYIPAIVLAEIGYLSEKKRIDTTLGQVKQYCQIHPSLKVEPITEKIIYKTFMINDIPELHDRIIAGTASCLNLELITNDQKIMESSFVSSIW